MTTYISILRGINVRGQNMIKMEALKKMYVDLGFQKVQTYIQSGNVIFISPETNAREIELVISKQIALDFGYVVPVIVLSVGELKAIVEANPFVNTSLKDPSLLHVTFLANKPAPFDEAEINSKILDNEAFVVTSNAVYLYCPAGYGITRLSNTFLEKKLKVSATTRNWKTTTELLKLALT